MLTYPLRMASSRVRAHGGRDSSPAAPPSEAMAVQISRLKLQSRPPLGSTVSRCQGARLRRRTRARRRGRARCSPT
jgi:hypothetical protein